MSILTVENVTSGYGQMEILHDVSMRIHQGEIVSIIGPNGAGKSTLLKTIFGLLKPSRGSIHLQDKDITGMVPSTIVQHGLSYVPQVDNVFPSLTVMENLEMGAFIINDHRKVQARLVEIFELFPILAERQSQRVGKMSGGERQMVAMGRALMLNPFALLLDEPTAALAPMLADMIFKKIAEINASGISILIVEQNARQTLSISHRGYVLADGKNKLEGHGSDLLADPEVGKLYLGG
jgi:branched-chain amino acid transport system ATP-binding protein/neutral amino acid transport system ATP-binding protein